MYTTRKHVYYPKKIRRELQMLHDTHLRYSVFWKRYVNTREGERVRMADARVQKIASVPPFEFLRKHAFMWFWRGIADGRALRLCETSRVVG